MHTIVQCCCEHQRCRKCLKVTSSQPVSCVLQSALPTLVPAGISAMPAHTVQLLLCMHLTPQKSASQSVFTSNLPKKSILQHLCRCPKALLARAGICTLALICGQAWTLLLAHRRRHRCTCHAPLSMRFSQCLPGHFSVRTQIPSAAHSVGWVSAGMPGFKFMARTSGAAHLKRPCGGTQAPKHAGAAHVHSHRLIILEWHKS